MQICANFDGCDNLLGKKKVARRVTKFEKSKPYGAQTKQNHMGFDFQYITVSACSNSFPKRANFMLQSKNVK